MSSFTGTRNIQLMVEGQDSAYVLHNVHSSFLDGISLRFPVLDRDLATPPGSPSEGDAYLVATSGTGDWSGHDGEVAKYVDGTWLFFEVVAYDRVYVVDENVELQWDGSAYQPKWDSPTVSATVTASTTQTQGQGAQTATIVVVTTCANANDTVTLPTASKGRPCLVINEGAQTLKLYPASGDSIGTGSVDASTTIAAGSRLDLVAIDSTKWKVR